MNISLYTLLLLELVLSQWPDPYCEDGHKDGSACFKLDCPQFGGAGCQSECCYNYIMNDPSVPFCDEIESGNTCKIREADPWCVYGQLAGNLACYPIACPQFGGVGCRTPCCFYEYQNDNRPSCKEAGPGCRMGYCDTDVALDIFLLIDDTTSLDVTEYTFLIELVERLITYDINSKSYVSIAFFSGSRIYDFQLDFTLADSNGKDIMLDVLENNNRGPGRRRTATFHGSALVNTLPKFDAVKDNDRPDLLLMFTDGVTNDNACDMITDSDIGDIEIVLIGIGEGIDQNLLISDTFNCLYNDQDEDVFYFADFTPQEFYKKEEELRQKLCREQLEQQQNILDEPSHSINNGEYNMIALSVLITIIILQSIYFLVYYCYCSNPNSYQQVKQIDQ